MKHFRTMVGVSAAGYTLNLGSGILTAGSCFAGAIGSRLMENKFRVMSNPFGVIYNPISIHKVLMLAAKNQPVPADGYLQNQDIHLHYDLHSSFSSTDREILEQKITHTISEAHHFLKDAAQLLITYGTAFVYQRNDEIVANCHKMPAAHFSRSLLTEAAITESFKTFYATVKSLNPGIRLVLTVSPVRHLRDGLEKNSVSKSILRVACHTITETFADVEYFPAFEIMMDDLRDYRFYKSDMLHPTEEAEDYIWSSFAGRYFDQKTKQFLDEWASVLSALRHKPFHPQSAAHRQFLEHLLRRLEALSSKVDVRREIDQVRAQLSPVHR